MISSQTYLFHNLWVCVMVVWSLWDALLLYIWANYEPWKIRAPCRGWKATHLYNMGTLISQDKNSYKPSSITESRRVSSVAHIGFVKSQRLLPQNYPGNCGAHWIFEKSHHPSACQVCNGFSRRQSSVQKFTCIFGSPKPGIDSEAAWISTRVWTTKFQNFWNRIWKSYTCCQFTSIP